MTLILTPPAMPRLGNADYTPLRCKCGVIVLYPYTGGKPDNSGEMKICSVCTGEMASVADAGTLPHEVG